MNRVRLQGTVAVAAPLAEAYALFTPTGERRWATGWNPSFPDAPVDETAPGTVFTTAHAGPVTWIVARSERPRAIAYAQVAARDRAGLIEVVCDEAAGGTTIATVTYDLTALSPEGARRLERFADGYEAFLRHWEHAIAHALAD
jgi:hypothetical protein